jgi:hypothetical protein
MRYCFATLAVNEPYESKSQEFYKELREKTEHGNFFITTTNEEFPELGDKIFKKVIKPHSLYCSGGGFDFHLNLKCLSLKHVIEFEKNNPDIHHDYVIFTDGDWGLWSGFSEDKILRMLDHMDELGLECLFERPAPIGAHKENPNESFFREKLYDYDVFDHSKWDEAHCVNEQILVLKNNWKFKFFVQRWEQFLWYSIANDIRNYPDGFEIGISILESEMNYAYQGMLNHHLNDCFYFYTKTNDLHVRF